MEHLPYSIQFGTLWACSDQSLCAGHMVSTKHEPAAPGWAQYWLSLDPLQRSSATIMAVCLSRKSWVSQFPWFLPFFGSYATFSTFLPFPRFLVLNCIDSQSNEVLQIKPADSAANPYRFCSGPTRQPVAWQHVTVFEVNDMWSCFWCCGRWLVIMWLIGSGMLNG